MQANMHAGVGDAKQDARWCIVPTVYVAARSKIDRQQQLARKVKATAEVQCWQLTQAISKRLATVRMSVEV